MTEPTEDLEPDDGEEVAPVRPEGRMARLERMLAPQPPRRRGAPGKQRSTKWSIDRLDGRERVYGYGAALVAVFFAVLVYVVESNDKHLKLTKGQFSPTTTLIVGLVGAVALAVSTWIGRRALVGFVALFVFLGFSQSDFIVGLPFLVLAAWLLYRSYKVQKEATARLRADRRPVPAAAASDASARGPRASAASGREAAQTRAQRKKGPTGPEANKRYTPKKPARPRYPSPSRRGGSAGRPRPRTDRPTVRPAATGGRPRRGAQSGSVTSAERRRSRISLRRRTSERAVGSSPKARSTSTSVSIPITVE